MNKIFLNRKSLRIKEYDYSQPNWYYITICTYDMKCSFGKISNGEIKLSDFGKIVKKEWERTKEIRKNIELDYYIIMSNHIHGIIIIEQNDVRAHCNVPVLQQESFGKSTKNTIPTIVKLFKATVTKQINVLRKHPVYLYGTGIIMSTSYEMIKNYLKFGNTFITIRLNGRMMNTIIMIGNKCL